MKNRYLSIFILLFLIALSSCNRVNKNTESETQTRASREGIAAGTLISQVSLITNSLLSRPSAQLSIFTSSFIAQKGAFLRSLSAINAIYNHSKIIINQAASSETFQLLSDIANLIQINVVDMLNRSTNRSEALNQYTETLKSTGKIVERKYLELQEKEEQLKNERKEKRSVVNTLKREINLSYKNEEFGNAASKQEELTEAESQLAKTESELDQTNDLIKRFEDMLDIASKRVMAISKNREVLIAGLKVTDMPGIENLDILEESKKYNRRTKSDGGFFGQEYLESPF